ncbi:hypothetical protein ABKN59_003240 [Abortiporus biennis]
MLLLYTIPPRAFTPLSHNLSCAGTSTNYERESFLSCQTPNPRSPEVECLPLGICGIKYKLPFPTAVSRFEPSLPIHDSKMTDLSHWHPPKTQTNKKNFKTACVEEHFTADKDKSEGTPPIVDNLHVAQRSRNSLRIHSLADAPRPEHDLKTLLENQCRQPPVSLCLKLHYPTNISVKPLRLLKGHFVNLKNVFKFTMLVINAIVVNSQVPAHQDARMNSLAATLAGQSFQTRWNWRHGTCRVKTTANRNIVDDTAMRSFMVTGSEYTDGHHLLDYTRV